MKGDQTMKKNIELQLTTSELHDIVFALSESRNEWEDRKKECCSDSEMINVCERKIIGYDKTLEQIMKQLTTEEFNEII